MIKQVPDHHVSLKTELINAGIKVISEEGIDNFSLRKVAAICRVSHAAPYKHFKNKEDLLHAIIEEMQQEFQNQLEATAMLSEQGTKQNILDIEMLYVEFMVQHPVYFKMLFFYKLTPSLTVEQIRNEAPLGIPFDLLIKSTKSYFKVHPKEEQTQLDIIITLWALSYGLASLIINKNLSIQEGSQSLIKEVLSEYLNTI
jgi:AcrR family transcriptional regulator